MTTLVAGVGNPDRGDDAAGPVVAAAVSLLGLPGVFVVAQEDPTDLVLAWEGHDRVVVVDAVVSGAPPGTVVVTEAGADAGPRPSWERLGLGGSHAFGLAEAIDLARALGRLPRQLTIVGVEAACVTPGAPVSPAVAAAVPAAVAAVAAALTPHVRRNAPVSARTTAISPHVRGRGARPAPRTARRRQVRSGDVPR